MVQLLHYSIVSSPVLSGLCFQLVIGCTNAISTLSVASSPVRVSISDSVEYGSESGGVWNLRLRVRVYGI